MLNKNVYFVYYDFFILCFITVGKWPFRKFEIQLTFNFIPGGAGKPVERSTKFNITPEFKT